MRKNRFSKFVEIERKNLSRGINTYKGKGFITKITNSLNESGYKVSRPIIASAFTVYLIIFFFIGYSLIAPMFFNVPKNISIEEIVNNANYIGIKDNLFQAGLSNTHIVSVFYKSLRNDKEINRYFEDNTVLKNAGTISVIIKEKASKALYNVLKIQKGTVPDFEIDVASIYNEVQKDKTIDEKKNDFLNAVKSNFVSYISNPRITLSIIKMSEASKQNVLFKFAFGVILLFQGLLIFFAFINQPLQEMSLIKLKKQIRPWLQMLTNSIQAGNSLSQALSFSKERVNEAPLSPILQEITARYETYKNLEQALKPLEKWADRVPELKNIISALVIQERMGGNLIPVLYSISNLFSKRILVEEKIESLASEATGQLKIIFIMFFFIILISELFMKSFKSPLSPAYMFFSKGGGVSGFLSLSVIHIVILTFSYLLYKGGEVIVRNEMKF